MSEVLADVELPDVSATVEQRITDGNGGPVIAYRLVIGGGRACLEPVRDVGAGGRDRGGGEGGPGGRSDEGDNGAVVVMSQSAATASAVRQGELGALAALQAGLIKVSGDVRVLIAAAEALAKVDAALGAALGKHNDAETDGKPDDGETDRRDGD